MIKNLNKKIRFPFIIILVIFTFFSFNSISHASQIEIYFQKESKEIIKGDIFRINLRVSSPEKIVNVIDGKIIYDKDKLEITKVKIDNSLISLWVLEPVINNQTGELSFTGGVPNGFKGIDGQILEITFLAKKVGPTLIGFKDIFSVFINDGKGTSINPWLKPMSLSISKKPDFFTKNISDYLVFVKADNNYKYYIGIFVLIILTILIKFKKKKNGK